MIGSNKVSISDLSVADLSQVCAKTSFALQQPRSVIYNFAGPCKDELCPSLSHGSVHMQTVDVCRRPSLQVWLCS